MSEKMKNNKYNRTEIGANKAVFGTFAEDTEMNKTVNAGKKKATFEMDASLHRRLKRHAADNDTTMVTLVERALDNYFKKQN